MTVLTFGGCRRSGTLVDVVFVIVVVISSLAITSTTTHANITSDTNATTLFCDNATELGAFAKTRELLG
jgi:hypothetical protein